MEFLKRYWTQIRAQLEGLSVSQKWAISVTLVLGLLLAGLAVMVAGRPELVAISSAASGQSEQILSRLRSRGINVEQQAGQIMVPAGQEERAYAALAEGDLLSADTSRAFRDLIERQSPWQTDKQSEQAYLLAKQRVLSQIIGKMRGVRSASVLVSMPRNEGFGRSHVEPSASVTVWMDGSSRVSDDMVESVAHLVAGAVAEMPPTAVSVTDGNHGRTRTINDEDELLPSEMLEFVQVQEQRYERKINGMLGYIPGVMVAVNVRVDDIARAQETIYDYRDTQPLESEEAEQTTRRETRDGGEPGARTNTGMNITGGNGDTTTEEMTRERTEFAPHPLTSERHVSRVGRNVQQINVSINVPRRFFVQIYKANNPDAEDEPTDADLQPIVEQHLERIEGQVEPIVQAESQSMVRADMVPDESLMPAVPGGAPAGRAGATLVADWIQPVSIGFLALVSLVLMLSMVRKATRKEDLPSAEELAGVPATLEADDELLGDVDDSDAALAGVELNEDELQSRRIAEQLNDMVKDNPTEAGQLLSRWVQKRE
ncbi:MAG: hypothetical protein ACODAQ_00230 [Phycisphaeraceae bacterium]